MSRSPLITRSTCPTAALLALAAWLGGCAGADLPVEAPTLVDLEEPLALRLEPDDEAARTSLPVGGFTGLEVRDPARALDAGAFGTSEGLPVERVIQNSPAQAAGVRVGDLLLAVGRGADERPLEWASEWREVELGAAPGTRLQLLLDRAGRDLELEIEVQARLACGPRAEIQRYRETDRVGLVLRSATEVEARAAGLGPGAGAVVVGLSAGSPWRAGAEGVLFGDLIAAVEGHPVAHVQVVLDEIRGADEGGKLDLDVWRPGRSEGPGRSLELRLPVSQREQETHKVSVPLLFSYTKQSDASKTSVLLGLLRLRRTRAAWDVRLLWLISFGGGDADRLEEVRE